MRKDVERELLAELRGYYTHFPCGHSVVDYQPEWRRGSEIWQHINSLSKQLMDNNKFLNATIEELREEGLVKDL